MLCSSNASDLLSVFQLSLGDEQSEVTRNGYESKELVYLVHIYCQVRLQTPVHWWCISVCM